MTQIRLSAVSYLNTRPLVYGLEHETAPVHRFVRRPGTCAALLHEGRVDLGSDPGDRVSARRLPARARRRHRLRWAVASVAVFSRGRLARANARARHQLADLGRADPDPVRPALEHRARASSRSNPICVPCCRVRMRRWSLATRPGDRRTRARLVKTDLGSEWLAMTGLPFVYAMWSGRADVAHADHVAALNTARDRGVAAARRLPGSRVTATPAVSSRPSPTCVII